jgi:RimJ/RimL family protein N-acetyltransferase
MIEYTTPDIPKHLESLFQTDEPGGLRLLGVLDGVIPGQLLTDNATWAVARENMFGTLFLGGNPSPEIVSRAIEHFKPLGEVLFGAWPDDPRLALFPTRRDYDGWTLDFDQRSGDLSHFTVPEGCEIRPIDAALFQRCSEREWYTTAFGDGVLESMRGYALMSGDDILCEAYTLPVVRGIRELAVVTREGHMRKGYATAVCAAAIREAEAAGYQTYWNCAAQNVASAALARKLGFQRERKYRLLAWM